MRKKCEQLQQANEKIVNRIQHVKKLIKRYKRERRFLTNRLDEHGDDYKDAQIPVMWEEDQIHNPLRAMKSSNGKAHGVKHSSDIISAVSPRVLADMGQISSSKSKKKVEKAKDFVGPKKPANAFLLFCQHRRTAVSEEYFKEKHEEISNHELTRRIALEWNILKPDQKKIYFDLYEQEKEQYEREMKIYTSRNCLGGSTESLTRDARAQRKWMLLPWKWSTECRQRTNDGQLTKECPRISTYTDRVTLP